VEKINIYVPENIGAMLENDAVMFEVYKKDGRTVNKNRFLGLLIKGYYEDYISEARTAYDTIISSIETDKLTHKDKEEIADVILKRAILPVVPSRKGKNPARLSLKPTKDTETLIDQILADLNGEDYISQYFCRMFMSYCDKPFSKREQIIFKDNYEILQECAATKQSISFKTIWNEKDIHEVIPYKVVTGPEEMFNYLLCAEINSDTGEQETKTYRLNRIGRINYGKSRGSINDVVKHNLELMIQYGPQYMINDDEESCVRLSSYGVKSFNRIYYGRPQFERIEVKDGQTYYYFRCSSDQLFLYFKRFEGDAAEIIYPKALRERMIRFHADSLETYKER